ncbi:hypothetical protein [Paenibacillus flagellatus]|uniref:PRD domain-containing protein n=1 Tax=Paenibacillus flagellatus TaxID=2211139 RepID=A0A2V5K4M4_9BACL|nr:hypothetical protein [Paenibacillus flagellatus]PYI52663.1 hypothetical protein DLM86_21085 [Paenibacillus flagellatus]
MRIEERTEAVADIVSRLDAEPGEKELVASLLHDTLRAAADAGVALTPEQRLGVGTHMLAAVRRGASREVLPPVGTDTLEQVSRTALDLSRSILEPFAAAQGYEWNDTEVLLLAVHFEAAMEG